MSTLDHRIVRIRKPHRCCYCDLAIATGSEAHRIVYKDGGICTAYAHQDCQSATEWAKWDYIDYESHGDPLEFREHTLAGYLQSKAAGQSGAPSEVTL